ncbi:MAG TPA: WD40 repeat domain-containing protein, partial [Planctomycetota bacterium]|nr:WD40 repeat domain-containing protein [Planctomycetota bacterium]
RLDEAGAARTWLDTAPEALRGFEWRHLRAQSDRSLSVLPVPESPPFRVSWSADGARLAVGCEDGSARVLDAATGATLLVLRGHKRPVFEVAFDPAGARVATCAEDGRVCLWDAGSGAPLGTPWEHSAPVASVAFSPDGRRFAASNYEMFKDPMRIVGTVKVFDAETGAERSHLTGGVKPLVSVRFSPDGRTLGASSWDGEVHLWDLQVGGVSRCLKIPDEGLYNAADGIAFSPDGLRVAAASKDRTARVWDIASGALLLTLRGHGGWVGSVAFSPDGRSLATASRDGTVRLWDAESGGESAVLRGHGAVVHAAAFRPDGARLASSAADGTVRVWSTDPRDLPPSALCAEHDARGVSFSPDGSRIFEGSSEGIRVRDAVTGATVATLPGGEATGLAVSRDGRRAAGCGEGGRVSAWDAVSGERLWEREAHRAYGHCVAFTPDGGSVASGARDGSVVLLDAATGEVRWTARAHEGAVASLVFDPAGTSIVTAGRDRRIRVLSAATGEVLDTLERDAVPWSVATEPGGRRLAWGDERGRVHLLDLPAREDRVLESSHPARVVGLAFDAAGTRLFSLSSEVRVHDPATGALLSTLRGLDDPGWAIAASPDGTRVAATVWGKRVAAWDEDGVLRRCAAREASPAPERAPRGE